MVRVTLADESLYVHEVYYESGITTGELTSVIPDKVPDPYSEIYCDAAEPKTIEELYRQGLTDEEISELIRNTHNTGSFVRAIEAKLKEKNT